MKDATANHEPVVFRQLAIPLSVFDRIKQFQRRRDAATGTRMTLNQTLSTIVQEHKEYEEREERNLQINSTKAPIR